MLTYKSSEALVKRTVDTMVAHGYKSAGYEFVVIDDCWLEMDRDPQTQRLVPDRERFPNGMKAVGDYVSIYSGQGQEQLL